MHPMREAPDRLGQIPKPVSRSLRAYPKGAVGAYPVERFVDQIYLLAEHGDLLAHVVVQLAGHPGALRLERRHLPGGVIAGCRRDLPLCDDYGGPGRDHQNDGDDRGGDIKGPEFCGLGGHRIPRK